MIDPDIVLQGRSCVRGFQAESAVYGVVQINSLGLMNDHTVCSLLSRLEGPF
jgi:hypothetical protein